MNNDIGNGNAGQTLPPALWLGVPVWQLRWEDAIIVPPSVSRLGVFGKLWRWQKHIWEMIMNIFVGGLAKPVDCSLRNRETNLSAIGTLPMDNDRHTVLKHHLANLQGLLTVLDCQIRDIENLTHSVAWTPNVPDQR